MTYATVEEAPPRSSSMLAALTRIGQHYGLTLDPDSLARAVPFDGAEPAIPVLQRMAERTGLTARPIRIQRGDLMKLVEVGPALLVLPGDRAAILETVDSRDGMEYALINDPMAPAGVSALVDEHRLFDLWDGEVILFKRKMDLTDEQRPFGAGWLIGQLVRDRVLMRDVGVAAFLMSLLSLTPFLVVMVMIDRVLDAHSFDTLSVLAIAVAIITVFDTWFGFLRRQLVAVFSSRIDARINLYVFDRVLNLPMAFFERVPTGMISAKMGQIWHIRHFMTGQIFGTLLDGSTLVVLLPFLFYLNWILACFVLLIALSILGVYWLFLPSLRRAHAKVTAAEQAMGAHQVESIHGIRTIKSLSLEGMKRKERDLKVAEAFKAHRDAEFLANWPQTIVRPLEMLIYIGSFLGLTNDGRFFSDEVYYEPEVAQRQRDRLARPDPFSNECTGLTPAGEGRFVFAQGDRPIRKIDGTVAVLLSDEPLSYGSFLFRFLPKVQTLRRLGLNDIRILTHPPSDSCRVLLRLVGIADENIIEHDLNAVTVIDRAIMPGLRNPNTFFAPESCALFAEIRKQHGPPAQTRRLYVSRHSLNAEGWSTRILRNEVELIARLASLGFEVIEPENMPVEDQIAAFAAAMIVVGPSGSGMFNSVFCHPGTKLIDIQSEPQWIYSYAGMYSSLSLRWGIFVGKADVIECQPFHRPWDVNIDALITRVEAFLAA